ncbi:FAD-dependent oxidoreductase [Clostridium estertheticum]|uniref:FAD-dependent oxidoreductase n=1 Tax=Clostridium estertheticum subsp. estertheticum TaxID=1552 RepID=A0A1J0GEK2_9CLOT|nr:FAD-dependent oxidoreductase [Clostridium estertheticum]APC39432.1 FAD-dependent oxidoreductase [Clostridium estertheticum subsp. estertheticum]MBU3072108.1 FAD-dependent oxidoreductase [Clostridium estertheticum]MBU3162200.1 FAD-dependent oxidoreductase [Clostridium estertheticum]MBU3170631.1 FAD-dependent oxidoreductase [Clostridium estertheticum]MBZ9614546.1 FAD-dependent oxidoreductase [Clostridium estertheticum subsp. laramiense]
MKVIVIGGGWSGCMAAITAKKAGAEVALYEKTDMLLGLGNVGGIMRNNGRYTAAEELIALGTGEFIHVTDENTKHKNIDFPGHKNAWLYDVNKIEPAVGRYLKAMDIEVNMITRVVNIKKEDNKIKGIYLSDKSYVAADAFIETTGSAGPMNNCLKYGNGCAMCILRCPAFGGRVSISSKAGIEDLKGEREEEGVYGAFSGSGKLAKGSLANDIVEQLDATGVLIVKVPKEDVNLDKLKLKVCQQYALKEFAENLILIDTGDVKLMTPYYPLEKLRKIKGFENAKYVDPYAGGIGNSIRYVSIAPRDDSMKVNDLDNLFCAGEKSGLFIGHTEAMATGALAGYNAVKNCLGLPPLILPRTLAVGDIIAYANEKMQTSEGRKNRYTFAGAEYFKRMKELGLYTLDKNEIKSKVENLDLTNIFNKKLI